METKMSIKKTLLLKYCPIFMKTSPASQFVPLRLALQGYSVTLLPRRFALSFSGASFPRILRFALTKI